MVERESLEELEGRDWIDDVAGEEGGEKVVVVLGEGEVVEIEEGFEGFCDEEGPEDMVCGHGLRTRLWCESRHCMYQDFAVRVLAVRNRAINGE